MLEMIFGILNLLTTWRFCVVLFAFVASYFVLVVDAIPVGMPRVLGLLCSAAVGSLLGGVWQRRHEQALGVSGK
jgi:hypothetical protein